MIIIVFVSVLAFVRAQVSGGTPCTNINTVALTGSCGGATYSLQDLAPNQQDYFTFNDAANGYFYFFQVINSGLGTTTTANTKTCTLPSAGYSVGQLNTATGVCYPLAQIPSKATSSWSLDGSQNPQVLSVTMSGGQGGRKAVLDVACYPGATSPVVMSTNESPALTYNFVVKSCCGCGAGCGGPSPPGPPTTGSPTTSADTGGSSDDDSGVGGAVFLSLLFGGLFLYFVIGAIYLNKTKGATGTEMIINKDFWTSLPGYIKEGCRYSWSLVSRSEYQRL